MMQAISRQDKDNLEVRMGMNRVLPIRCVKMIDAEWSMEDVSFHRLWPKI
jgi:hypothetical protein